MTLDGDYYRADGIEKDTIKVDKKVLIVISWLRLTGVDLPADLRKNNTLIRLSTDQGVSNFSWGGDK